MTGSPVLLWPTTMRPSRALRSLRSVARPMIAITSLAAVMSNPVSRDTPFFSPPRPTWMCRSARSFMSTTRRQEIRSGSRLWGLSNSRLVSVNAASRLLAAVIAWKSPVRWRLNSSGGTTWE